MASTCQSASVSTLTIELSDDLAARLVAASEHAHLPPAQFAQVALEKALKEPLSEAGAVKIPFDAKAHLVWLRRNWGDRVFSTDDVEEMRDYEDHAERA
jgi:hypothetical protein